MLQTQFYRTCLQGEFARRRDKNPRYSVRAFARALRINDGALSQILSGKRIPSHRTATRLLAELELTPEQERKFLGSLSRTHLSRGLQRMSPVLRQYTATTAPGFSEPHDLSTEIFRTIADWYHVAILELSCAAGFRSDPKWIAGELGISVVEAQSAIERMLALGLLERRQGKLRKSHEQLNTADKHLTTAAHKRFQRQILEKAIHSLENDSIEERNMAGMTMAIAPKNLPLAREMIRQFMRSICEALEAGTQERVYHLSVNLFPIQKNPFRASGAKDENV